MVKIDGLGCSYNQTPPLWREYTVLEINGVNVLHSGVPELVKLLQELVDKKIDLENLEIDVGGSQVINQLIKDYSKAIDRVKEELDKKSS